MRSRAYIIIGISALLFASCGRQHKAESLAKDFVAENMENPSAISGKDFADIGTTRHLNDSLITVMRQRGASGYKKGISYGKMPLPENELYKQWRHPAKHVLLRLRAVGGCCIQITFFKKSCSKICRNQKIVLPLHPHLRR